MIKCDFCNTLHVPNTIFCSECGQYLLEVNSPATKEMSRGRSNWLADVISKPSVTYPVRPVATNHTLRLKIGEARREVEVQLERPVHVGRLDPSGDIFPEVDISQDDKQAILVSRRHIRLFGQRSGILVEDLGSINGTYLNGQRLPPFIPESLSNGDSLLLGTLPIEIEILD